MCESPCFIESPWKTLRALPFQVGVIAPLRHGKKMRPSEPAGTPSASRVISSKLIFATLSEYQRMLPPETKPGFSMSHNRESAGHTDLYREHIDLPVFKSMLWDYEDLLMNDGCTGIAVLNPSIPQEVQFDEHKLLIVYGKPLNAYEDVFQKFGVRRDDQMKFITEAEHVHSSSDRFAQRFEELKMALGMDSGY
jgi:hypothetical protein